MRYENVSASIKRTHYWKILKITHLFYQFNSCKLICGRSQRKFQQDRERNLLSQIVE